MAIISRILQIWIEIGVRLSFTTYFVFGLAPSLLGWPTVIVMEIVMWEMEVAKTVFGILLFHVNVAVVALTALYFQIKYSDSHREEIGALNICVPAGHSKGPFEVAVGAWMRLSISMYSFFSVLGLILGLTLEAVSNSVALGLTTVGLVMLVVNFYGGRKGKLWEQLKKVAELRLGGLPRSI